MKSINKLLTLFFALFLLFIVFLNSANACTCRRMTAEEYLNHSDYSCTFKIIDETEKAEWHSIFYNATRIECEKLNDEAEILLGSNVTDPVTIRTSNQESTCGVTLMPDNTYKIMGQVTSDEILVLLCNYIKQLEPELP